MKFLVLFLGLILAGGGAYSIWIGYDIIQVEVGWSEVIAGATALAGGVITFAIGCLIWRIDALRKVLLSKRLDPPAVPRALVADAVVAVARDISISEAAPVKPQAVPVDAPVSAPAEAIRVLEPNVEPAHVSPIKDTTPSPVTPMAPPSAFEAMEAALAASRGSPTQLLADVGPAIVAIAPAPEPSLAQPRPESPPAPAEAMVAEVPEPAVPPRAPRFLSGRWPERPSVIAAKQAIAIPAPVPESAAPAPPPPVPAPPDRSRSGLLPSTAMNVIYSNRREWGAAENQPAPTVPPPAPEPTPAVEPAPLIAAVPTPAVEPAPLIAAVPMPAVEPVPVVEPAPALETMPAVEPVPPVEPVVSPPPVPPRSGLHDWLERALAGHGRAANEDPVNPVQVKPVQADAVQVDPVQAYPVQVERGEVAENIVPATEIEPAPAISLPIEPPAAVEPQMEATPEAPPASPLPAPPAEPEQAPPAEPEQAPQARPIEEPIGRYEARGTTYLMYADGSIEAETSSGRFRFASMAELKAFIERGQR